MFGKFGGIVIIALSIAIVAGLIIRPAPEHPVALSLGITDSKVATEGATKTLVQETTETVETKMEEAKDIMADKAEELKSETIESIKETVTDTVESTDEVVGVVKETVEKQSETKSK